MYPSPPPSAPTFYGQPPTTSSGIPVQPTQYYNTNVNTPGFWTTGLCGCCSDLSNCCVTCCCPCITFGQIAEIIDKGSNSCGVSGALYCLIASVTGCGCMYSCFYRSKMRKQYTLPESPCNDCLVHFCCECCALCQEYRELKNRGLDPSRGWQWNMERQNQGVNMAPVVQGGMYR